MRLTFTAVLMIAWPAVALAQQSPTSIAMLGKLPPIGFPLPPITAPLPPITAPLAPIGLPPIVDAHRRVVDDRQFDHRARFDGRRQRRSQPTVVLFVPTFGYQTQTVVQTVEVPAAAPPPAPVIERAPRVATAFLRLDVQPNVLLQLYVDGYYVGTSGDVNGELELEPGAHKIELRADGYETHAFDVRIAAGRSITYQAQLKRDPAAGPEPKPATPQTTIYFIPGCYLGNLPPSEVKLPANCDLSRLITHTPQR